MDREPLRNPRCYRHNCPAHGNREQQIAEEICPECGQRGEFYRWFIGMYARIGRLQRVLGFPCVGPHMTFLPAMTRGCQRCHEEGILAGWRNMMARACMAARIETALRNSLSLRSTV